MSKIVFTAHLTLIEESTVSVAVEADNIAEAEKIAEAIDSDDPLGWQYDQSHVEVDEVCNYDYLKKRR